MIQISDVVGSFISGFCIGSVLMMFLHWIGNVLDKHWYRLMLRKAKLEIKKDEDLR